jgi:two-component system, cell cycle sensor histidine kinase PleC
MKRGMSIRGRLVTLVIGAVVPLTIVGLVALWSLWSAKRQQLDESLEQQAELAAVVFDRWLDAQRQPLVTLAAYGPERLRDPAALREDLAAAATPRRHWVDVRVLGATGATLAAYPPNAETELPAGLGERLVAATRRADSAAETDWAGSESRYLLAVAVPAGDGAVVARVDDAALAEQFRGLTLPERALVTLLDPSHRVIFRSQSQDATVGAELTDATTRSALESGPTSVVVRSSLDGVERVYGLSRVGATGYSVTVGVPSAFLYAPARRQLATYAFMSLAVMLATVGAALLVARSIVAPLRLLSATAVRFGEGDFSARASSADMETIALLASSFNSMAERLEEREARMAEVDRVKSDFVSSVSHELRTPLTTIKALARLLAREGLTPEKRKEYLDTIAAECDRQIDLVLNLLDLSRIEGGVFRTRVERVDIPEIVAACAKAAARAVEMRGHELVVDVDSDLPAACADAKALGRVLGNVVENAIKYTPDGGRIAVAAGAEGEWVTVSVSDNGRGIPPEDVPRLFDKFHRGRAFAAAAPQSGNPDEVDVSGVGLGLYLARNVMEQMGGRIGVETELGRGSTFTLRLPVWHAGRCDAAAEEEKRDARATVGS